MPALPFHSFYAYNTFWITGENLSVFRLIFPVLQEFMRICRNLRMKKSAANKLSLYGGIYETVKKIYFLPDLRRLAHGPLSGGLCAPGLTAIAGLCAVLPDSFRNTGPV